MLKENAGNEAPEVSVETLFAADGEGDPLSNDKRVWSLISRKRRTSPTCILVDRDTLEDSLGPRL